MAAYFDMTAATAALKELYGPQVIQDMSYKDNPWFSMISKDENAGGGKYYPQPTIWSASQGVAGTFSDAQANQTAPQIGEFMVTLKEDFGFATIANRLIESASTDRESFIKPAKQNIDQMLRTLGNHIAAGGFRSGTGTIGKISTIGSVGTGVIQLDDPESVAQFERNQVLRANATDGGVSPRDARGYVISVDRVLAQVTVATSGLGGVAANPSGWTTGDYLYVQGNLNTRPSGLDAWIPATKPSSGESFYSVDRSVDTRLYGINFDGSGYSVEEALITGSKFIGREGGKTNACITNYTSYNAIDVSQESRRVRMEASPTLFFTGVSVNGHKGEFDVFPDRNCPGKVAYLLQTDTWKMISTNAVPHIFRGDGTEMLRLSNADAMEVRAVAYYNYVCNAPGYNGRVTLGC